MNNAKTLLIRADAGPRSGTGHLMRSLALAEAWRAAGGRVALAGHCTAESLRERIRAAGVDFHPLAHPHPHPSDLEDTLALLRRLRSEDRQRRSVWVALDGYRFDTGYHQAIRQPGCRLMVIDDTAGLPHYRADLLLNQNLGAERLDYACDGRTALLLGPRYALLRSEFSARKRSRRKTPTVARRLLVTLGGADPEKVTRQVVRALVRLNLPGLEARIIAGEANPHLGQLRAEMRRAPPGMQLITAGADMPELMDWADVAVCGAGSTCWELALMQLPAVLLLLADNQQIVAEQLAEAGAVVNLGRPGRQTSRRIATALASLCRDRDRRLAQSEAGGRLVDGRGAGRVVSLLHALYGSLPQRQLKLRPLDHRDLLPLWRLANDPAVRRFSLSGVERIPLKQHADWFRQKLSSPESCGWVLEFHGLMLAAVRYDRSGPDAAVVGLSVCPAFRNRGLGTKLVKRTAATARRRLGVRRIRAVVLRENASSARVFAKAGFDRIDSRRIDRHDCHIFERAA